MVTLMPGLRGMIMNVEISELDSDSDRRNLHATTGIILAILQYSAVLIA